MRRFFLHSWDLVWFLALAACSAKQIGQAAPPPSESRVADEVSTSKRVDSVESDKAVHVATAAPSGMVLVPGGPFFMGVDKPERGIEPGHMTDVASFAIDRTEVRVVDYLECQQLGKCAPDLHRESGCNAAQPSARAAHPMNCVTWHEANRFCVAQGKRLPTSTEWELAARGTDRRPYPWGSALPAEQLCWQGRKGQARSTTCPVGSFLEGTRHRAPP